MSSSKFAGEEKRRVAHTPNSVQTLNALNHKKESLSKMVSQINHGAAKPSVRTGFSKNGTAPKRAKYDEDDDDFVVDDDEDEEEMDDDDYEDMTEEEDEDIPLSDDDTKKRKKVDKVKRTTPTPPRNRVARILSSPSPTPKKKLAPIFVKQESKKRTLSDDDDDDEWNAKPRLGLNSGGDRMVTKASNKTVKEHRRIVLSSSEDDSGEEEGFRRKPPAAATTTQSAPAKPLVVKLDLKAKTKKQHDSDSDEDFDDGGDLSDARRESDSEDSYVSDGEARGMRDRCLHFFNNAPKTSLLNAPRIVDKIADHVIANRPFESFASLEQSLSSLPRCSGRALLDAYIEYLEKRGILEKILDDCNTHSETIAECHAAEAGKGNETRLLNPAFHLHEYQQAGLDWFILMYKRKLNCILADEMGLGKTIQVIAFLAWMKDNAVRGPHLVIVPSSTIENWMTEIKKWCPALKLITYYGSQDERRDIRHAAKRKKDTVDVLLTTYNMVGSRSDDKKFFKNFSINYVIFDEGHMLKNCATDRYKSLMKIKSQRKILLTGTPLQNNLIELISLMYFTMTRMFTKYCDDIGQLLGHFKQLRPALEEGEEHMYQRDRIEQAKQILQPYILRRVKAQVLSNLPPKTEETIEVPMQTQQTQLYEDTLNTLRTEAGDPSMAYGGLMRLRQAANHPLLRREIFDDPTVRRIAKVLCKKEKAYDKKKPEFLAEELEVMSDMQIHQLCEKYTSTSKFLLDGSLALESGKLEFLDKKLPEIKEKGDKVLIFSQFTTMLDILEVYLNLRGHSFVRLDGSTPVLERLEMITTYNNDPSQFVFLLSTKAGGLGINLTSANHIIIHDIDFNPYNDKQAEDRCHRMGQTKPVHVIRLISKDTIEVDIHRLAQKKLRLEKDVTAGSRGLEPEFEQQASVQEEVSAEDAEDLLVSVLSPKKK